MKIKANGIQMNYEWSGKKGSPVVMLSHSLGSSLLMWNPQIDSLERHFQVLRYDVRGHGQSDAPPGSYTLELLGKDALGLLDALGVQKVHWIGLSMGGMIGQKIALSHPEHLLSLALCDTTAVFTDEAQPIWDERIDKARHQGMGALVDETLERWFTPSFHHLNPPMLGVIRKEILDTPVKGYIGCSEAIRRLNYLEQLPRISTPTLILVGEDDPGTPVSASEAMHQRISGSQLVILPSARHLSNVEQPEAFNSALLKFLRGH